MAAGLFGDGAGNAARSEVRLLRYRPETMVQESPIKSSDAGYESTHGVLHQAAGRSRAENNRFLLLPTLFSTPQYDPPFSCDTRCGRSRALLRACRPFPCRPA